MARCKWIDGTAWAPITATDWSIVCTGLRDGVATMTLEAWKNAIAGYFERYAFGCEIAPQTKRKHFQFRGVLKTDLSNDTLVSLSQLGLRDVTPTHVRDFEYVYKDHDFFCSWDVWRPEYDKVRNSPRSWQIQLEAMPRDDRTIEIIVDEKGNAGKTCIKYCNKLAEVGYRLEDDYSYNFSVHNENSNENIFTIPLDKNLYAAQFWYLFRSRHYNHGGALGGSSENGTSANISTVLANGYGTDDVDARFEKNFYAGIVEVDGKPVMMDNGQQLEYFPLELKLNLTGSSYVKTAGARMAKYEVDRTSHSDGRQPDNDIVLFRYADALLMKSEAKVRNGEDGSLELNEVRGRVGMPYREATIWCVLEFITNHTISESNWLMRKMGIPQFFLFHKKV